MTFPDFETYTGGYTVGITYIDGGRTLHFNGVHRRHADASARARKVTAALIKAGEVGIKPHIGHVGERPSGFPRNGVTA